MKNKEYYMQLAIKEAKKAYKKKEMPIGCVIVQTDTKPCIYNKDKIVAKAHNMREHYNHVLSHAEVIALKKANRRLKCWHIEDCDIYITLEPCPMCAGAIINARIKNVYFGAYNQKGGCAGSYIDLFKYNFSNPSIHYEGGICEEECKELIQSFFKTIRNK